MLANLQLDGAHLLQNTDSPEPHSIYRRNRLIVPDTMEGEQPRASGMQPQGPLQAALRLQSGLRTPYKQGLTRFQFDRALLHRF